MNSKEFDDIIKNKAQQRQADVPADLWENITAQKKKRRTPFFWLLFLSLLLTGIAVEWKLTHKGSASPSVAEKNILGKIASGKGSYSTTTKNTGPAKATFSGAVPQSTDAVSPTKTTLADSEKKRKIAGSRSNGISRSRNASSTDAVKNDADQNNSGQKITARHVSDRVYENALPKDDKQTVSKHKPRTKRSRIKMNIPASETANQAVDIMSDEAVASAPVINENAT